MKRGELRRRTLEESLALQKSGVAVGKHALRAQRTALGVLIVCIAAAVGLFSLVKLLTLP